MEFIGGGRRSCDHHCDCRLTSLQIDGNWYSPGNDYISPLTGNFENDFPFPRWEMEVPWRVSTSIETVDFPKDYLGTVDRPCDQRWLNISKLSWRKISHVAMECIPFANIWLVFSIQSYSTWHVHAFLQHHPKYFNIDAIVKQNKYTCWCSWNVLNHSGLFNKNYTPEN